MLQMAMTVLVGVALSFLSGTNMAAAADDAYLADKYQQALQKGCPPVIVKRTVVAGALGIFFGGGLFFTEHYGGAIRDAILFPISWMWDPFLAVKAAREQNMQATVTACQASAGKSARK